MTKYKCINGWTKERMKAQIRLKNNGTKSEDIGVCLYRNQGNACAAGCFIPDEIYIPDMECKPSVLLVAAFPDLIKAFPLDTAGMRDLQRTHDTYTYEEDMRDMLCNWIDENVEDA